MATELRDLINSIAADSDQNATREMIQSELGQKALEVLEYKKQQLAQTLFSGLDNTGEDE